MIPHISTRTPTRGWLDAFLQRDRLGSGYRRGLGTGAGRRLDGGVGRDRVRHPNWLQGPGDTRWIGNRHADGEARGVPAEVGGRQSQATDLEQDVGPTADDDKYWIESEAAEVVAGRRPMRRRRNNQYHLLARRTGLGLDVDRHRRLVQPGLRDGLREGGEVHWRPALLQAHRQITDVYPVACDWGVDVDI